MAKRRLPAVDGGVAGLEQAKGALVDFCVARIVEYFQGPGADTRRSGWRTGARPPALARFCQQRRYMRRRLEPLLGALSLTGGPEQLAPRAGKF